MLVVRLCVEGGSLAVLPWGGSGDVAAKVCIMLWMQLLDCWNFIAIALLML